MATNISEQLKYNGGYVDALMSVNDINELKNIPIGNRFIGLTVTVKTVIPLISCDFWLVGSVSNAFWKIKNVPLLKNTDQLSALSAACGNMIPKGFIVGVNENSDITQYSYDGTQWRVYTGVPILGEDS